MATLQVTATTDFRGTAQNNIDTIEFINTSFALADFNTSQFGNGQISNSVNIVGSTSGSMVQVHYDAGITSFDARNWTYANDTNFSVAFYGTFAAETFTGSGKGETINLGGGLDTINARGGDDGIISDNNNGPDIIDGGRGLDQALINRSLSTSDFVIDISTGGQGLDIGDGTTLTRIELLAAYTGSGDDTITGGIGRDIIQSGGGDDVLKGGGEDDRITGGTGRDVMRGDGGLDIFIFEGVTDSARGIQRDLIKAFVQGEDLMDLSLLGGLSFNDTGAFDGSGMEVIVRQGALLTKVSVDIDGDQTADMQIGLRGSFALTAGDFLL